MMKNLILILIESQMMIESQTMIDHQIEPTEIRIELIVSRIAKLILILILIQYSKVFLLKY